MNGDSTESGTTQLTERYDIRQRLGSGGSADAYLAYDRQLRREVVIKVVRQHGDDERAGEKILEEAAKMASIKHPNIVALYDVSTMEGMPCIVMEHVDGQTLDELVDRDGPLGELEALEVARQALDALAAAHAHGMVHRDIKPSNIMVIRHASGQIQIKLLDFGMAKIISGSGPSPQTVGIDGSVTGSIYFISPEQLGHEPVDARSDLYSLGCSLYFALTGRYPFNGETTTEVIAAHLAHNYLPIEALLPTMHPGFARWIAKLMAREPSGRPESCVDALQGLREPASALGARMVTSAIPLAPPVPAVQVASSKRPPFLILGSLAVCFLGVVAGGVFLFGQGGLGPKEESDAEPVAEIVGEDALRQTEPAQSEESVALAEPTPLVVVAMDPVPDPQIPAPTPAAPAPLLATSTPVPAAEPIPDLTFRIVGSNTIGSSLMPRFVEAYLRHIGATDIEEGRQDIREESEIIFRMPGGQKQRIEILSHGSGTSFGALEKEEALIGMSSRPIKPAEADRLGFLGNMTSPACEHVVGLDGLAIIVHRTNPVTSLSVSEVRDIFTGEINDWAEVGGVAGPIRRYARDDKSGTFDSFQSMVLGDATLDSSSERFEDSGTLSDRVSVDAQGIGFIGLPYVRSSRALAIYEADSTPLLPSPFTVATEDYRLARRLFVYTPAVPSHPWVNSLIEFALSDAGQEVVDSVGFVSQRIEGERITPPDDAPPAYAELARSGALRLSLSFRFRPGSSELDSKGIKDLDRVVRALARTENRRKRCLLLGFSDDTGQPASNMALAEERARQLASELTLRGVRVAESMAFGSALPVATNENEAGREKNRRVEVWLAE